jgi:hypothetical protein
MKSFWLDCKGHPLFERVGVTLGQKRRFVKLQPYSMTGEPGLQSRRPEIGLVVAQLFCKAGRIIERTNSQQTLVPMSLRNGFKEPSELDLFLLHLCPESRQSVLCFLTKNKPEAMREAQFFQFTFLTQVVQFIFSPFVTK